MAYTIIKSDGTILTTIADGTLNTTSTSIKLPGRNYAGYGIYFDTNFVQMVENFANSAPPPNALRGQLWFNTNDNNLYVCPADGTTDPDSWTQLAAAEGNVDVTYGNITATGTVYANNATVVHNINGSNLSISDYANITTLSVSGNTSSGNTNITGRLSVSGNANVGNLGATGRVTATGLSTSYGVTTGNGVGAFNGIMGVSSSATWLLSGTSNGVFRAGIQALDAGGVMRFYEGANFMQFASNALTVAGTITGGNLGIGGAIAMAGTGGVVTIGPGLGNSGTGGVLRLVGSSNIAYIQSGIYNTSNSAAPLAFTTMLNGFEWMRLDEDGNLGINTTSPTSKLHVVGDGNITGNLSIGNYVSTPLKVGNATSNFQATAGGYTTQTRAANIGSSIGAPFWNIKAENSNGDNSAIWISAVDTGGSSGKFISADGVYYNAGNWRTTGTKTVATAIGLNGGDVKFYTDTGLTPDTNYSPTLRMVILDSGNVGIGNSTPTTKLSVGGTLFASGNANIQGTLAVNNWVSANNNLIINSYTGATQGSHLIFAYPGIFGLTGEANSTWNLDVNTGNTFRIFSRDSSGTTNVAIGLTEAGDLNVKAGIQGAGYVTRQGTSGPYTSHYFNFDWTGTALNAYVDTALLGSVTISSDYRIKANVATQEANAIQRVANLRPVSYEITNYGSLFKADNKVREGFIAHELAEIIPSAVEGEKDAPNQIQSLRLDAIVSVLTKAIQEQQAIIEDLKARIEQLEKGV